MKQFYDVVIVGGGFYGVRIALYLRRYFKKIAIIESADELLTKASYHNQARIHNGYHYPRSPLTALRSYHHFQRFLEEYPSVIDNSFLKLYAIAAQNSKVTAKQFEQFMRGVGAPVKEAGEASYHHFDPNLIEAVFEVEEVAFDAIKLKELLKEKIDHAGIDVFYGDSAHRIEESQDRLKVTTKSGIEFTSEFVFNCTYSKLNALLAENKLPLLPLKHELTEMALVSVPPSLQHVGITVMDGPFFSLMSFPSRQLHSFSHVRYTPHLHWTDDDSGFSFDKEKNGLPNSHFLFMKKDAQRYCPEFSKLEYQDSLFEVKTVLEANEADDGRPILFRQDYGGLKNFFVILGGKIDNVYDIFEKLDEYFTQY